MLHWSDQLNWLPLLAMGIAAALVFLARLITAWFFLRRFVVPPIISSMYFLCGVSLIVVTIWGLVSTAWWALPLGALAWYLVHAPFRNVMEAWASSQKGLWAIEDADKLLKGGLSPEEEQEMKRRLGLTK
ncbi:MAG TPA: hypothetical protein VG722_10535 [Tepidisphaeraceae bacterium]|nr:hypothetical protein [Tepidisphaeraceae bacterium]